MLNFITYNSHMGKIGPKEYPKNSFFSPNTAIDGNFDWTTTIEMRYTLRKPHSRISMTCWCLKSLNAKKYRLVYIYIYIYAKLNIYWTLHTWQSDKNCLLYLSFSIKGQYTNSRYVSKGNFRRLRVGSKLFDDSM